MRLLLMSVLLFFTGVSLAGPRILVLGDSLSAAHDMPVNKGWVHLLEQKLPDTATVVNASISGETTSGGRSRLPQLLERHEPDLLVLELGANDALRGQDLSATRANLSAMIDGAQQHADAQVLLLATEIPLNYGSAYRDRFRKIFADLAERDGVSLVPFFIQDVAGKQQYMQSDGLHPNAAAQPLILARVWPALEPLLTDLDSQDRDQIAEEG